MKLKIFSKKNKEGFTLIELVIALALFSTVVMIAAGGFVRALRTQRQLSAFASVNGNMGLVLEQMAREIRTGINFSNGTDGSPGVLSFINSQGIAVTYCLDGDILKRTTGGSVCSSGDAVTAGNILVQH